MAEEDNFECDKCGREFDTKRGLSSHETQAHTSDTEESENDGRINFSLSVYQALTGVFLLGVLLGFMGGIAAPVQITSNTVTAEQPTDGSQDNPSGTGNGQNSETIDMSKIKMKGEPVLGSKDAPVTMVVYEDFQCPFCKRFETGAMPKIVENYVKNDKVKVVWKDFPLPQLHPWAKPAAAAMECVYRKGGNQPFWNIKDKIFRNQNTLTTDNVQTKIKEWASQEGVSKSKIQTCLDQGNPMKEVNEDKKEGASLGVSGTPTAFINGKKLVGAQPYSRFKTVIENKLS